MGPTRLVLLTPNSCPLLPCLSLTCCLPGFFYNCTVNLKLIKKDFQIYITLYVILKSIFYYFYINDTHPTKN